MNRKYFFFLTFLTIIFIGTGKLNAQFTAGNIVVLQVGNGSQTLINTGNSLFLKEFTPAGLPGISVTIPDTGPTALIESGAATSEGEISRSSDGSAILVPGYNTNVPFSSSLASSSSLVVPRSIGKVDGCGNYSLAVTSTTFFNGNNIRSGTANITTNNYWACGANTGMCYYGTGTPAVVSTTVTNERVAQIFNGNLLFSTGSGTQGVYQISGQPTSGTTVATALATNPGGSPYGFAIDAASTTIYMADDRPFATTAVAQGGIEKFTWNGSSWVFQYTLQCGAGTFGARGLAVDFSGVNPIIYATTTEGSSNRLIKIIDIGAASGSAALVLATAPANTVYRGAAFSPIGAPSITSITSNAPVCAGTTLNFTAAVSGSPAFTYSWAGPNSFSSTQQNPSISTVTSAASGTYTLTVTNACGTTSQTISATINPSPTGTLTSSNNVSCFGNNNGSATISASGGTPSYTYAWTPSGGNAATASSLPAGNYTCTITDANTCSGTVSVAITQPAVLSVNSVIQFDVQCNGGNSGSASFNTNGGTPAYTYSWAPSGGTGPTASSLGAGTYTCTVTDAHGCILTQSFDITQSTALSATVSQSDISCNSGNNGSASVNVSGGTPSYTYAWSPSGGNAATASSLTSGNYTCTIHDGNSCILTQTFNITQPTALSATTSQSNVSCNGGNNGSASVTVSGGTPGYTYSWTPSGGNASTASSLTSGIYSCTITDLNGCVLTQTFNITQPTVISATASQINVSCNAGNNGSATVIASGGAPGYTYTWIPSGGNAATASSLSSGTYTCLITDANSCSFGQTFTITQPTALSATVSQTDILCNGGNNGSATVTVSGGSPAYTYSWTPSGGNAATASSLVSGNYTCVSTDANGCTLTQTFNITQPSALTASVSQTNVSCNAGNNGSASVTVSGGTLSYSYSWSPSGGNAATASSLTSGNYTCTITDGNSCTLTQSFTITEPSALTATTSQVNVACSSGNSGSATVSVSGGTPSYSYSWAPTGGNAATASSLAIGTYTCTITDANSCSLTQSFNITQPSTLAATSSQTDVSCNGGNNGSATVNASGGNPAYTYSWSPSGGTSAMASSLTSGNYTCTITDANGCSITQSFLITEPSLLSATSSQTNVLCNGGNSGSATVNVTGGTSSYNYSWLPSGGTNATASSLAQGNYTCTITDANGCSLTQSFSITQPALLAATSSQTNISCNAATSGSATVNVSGGTPSYSYSWSPSGGTAATASSLPSGNYTCTITDANGCTLTQSFNLTEPSAITSASSQTNILCNGGNNGSATVNPSGGSPTYTYAWTPSGGTNANALSLVAGTYSCTITDANGCTLQQTFSITQPSPISLTVSSSPACGLNNGNATANASGGTGSFTYNWTPSGGNTSSLSGLTSGNYSCTITDANGCAQNGSVTVVTNTNPTASVSAPVTIQLGTSTTLTASGGTIYNWNPSTGLSCTSCPDPVASPTQTSTYCVVATDANSCSDTVCTIVTVDETCPELFVPNVFSPNGDNENDLLCIYGKQCIKTIHFTIYDRWGEKVFETTDPDQCWDGTYKGKQLDPGVFVYSIEGTNYDEKTISKKGNITLLR